MQEIIDEVVIGDIMFSKKQILPSRVNTPLRRLAWLYRQATWRSRALPDVIIIGAQKAGTTSLYIYLSQHPQLLPSYAKEVHYFDGGLTPSIDNFEKGQAWYRAYFPLRRNISAQERTFEASPLYIFNPLAPKRIFDLVPKAKLILLLRNPTERAISHYLLEKRFNRESLPIWEALHEEEKRLEPVISTKDYKNGAFMYHSYKSRGLYKDQIERYFNYFPREQIFITNSEEFFSETDKTLERIFAFMGVDTGFKITDLKPRNVAKERPKFDAEVYEYLNNYFLKPNQELYELVGKNYGW